MAKIMQNILVTGATGYIGGRLLPRLLASGYHVRLLVRNPAQLQGRPWLDRVEIVQGDALDEEPLQASMQGIQTAYYLIHSMSSSEDFQVRDRQVACSFSQAARTTGLKRIIYLGGLGTPGQDLSPHLRSRHEVGRLLAESGIPLIEFRSAVIVGSGSAAFEMMRYTVEGLPVSLCPTWVDTRLQPISVRDVLDYLISALDLPSERVGAHTIVEIGGADIVTYHDMLYEYARSRGLHRIMFMVPFLPLKLCATWLHWITPISAPLAYSLIEGMRNEVIVHNDSAKKLFPAIQPRNYHTSLERALARLNADEVETTWSDAQISATGDAVPVVLTTREGLLLERRQRQTGLDPAAVFKVITGLGGKRGWLFVDWIWEIRGLIDRLFGGVGIRRGRRHADELRVGDALDFWRVEALDIDRLLRLRAEMKVPGKAWLQFELLSQTPGNCLLVQTAYFEPKGLPGLIYWYALYPIHGFIFSGLIRRIIRQAGIVSTKGWSR